MIRATTVNLGGGGPEAMGHKEAADTWAERVRHETTFDLLFVQEVHDQAWLDAWAANGWHVVVGSGPVYKPRSAAIARFPLVCVRYPTSDYHGSYVAVARMELGTVGDCFIASVHASPTRLDAGWLDRWDASGLPRPEPRTGLDLWDSDLVLESMRCVAAWGPLIVAGDWNEARGWDVDHAGVAGAQFFERVAFAGFVDCAHRKWGAEKPTHGTYQLDHVFATIDVARHVDVAVAPGGVIADHESIGFDILLHDD